MSRKFTIILVLLIGVTFTISLYSLYELKRGNSNPPAQNQNQENEKPGQNQEYTVFNVYFGNTAFDPQVLDCQNVFPVERRVLKTQAVAGAALEELLKGPTPSEEEQGYFTSINQGVKVQDLQIVDNEARVDFNDQLQYQVGGSCRVASIRSQITKTLEQFPTINSVLISINGETEEILQP